MLASVLDGPLDEREDSPSEAMTMSDLQKQIMGHWRMVYGH